MNHLLSHTPIDCVLWITLMMHVCVLWRWNALYPEKEDKMNIWINVLVAFNKRMEAMRVSTSQGILSASQTESYTFNIYAFGKHFYLTRSALKLCVFSVLSNLLMQFSANWATEMSTKMYAVFFQLSQLYRAEIHLPHVLCLMKGLKCWNCTVGLLIPIWAFNARPIVGYK